MTPSHGLQQKIAAGNVQIENNIANKYLENVLFLIKDLNGDIKI